MTGIPPGRSTTVTDPGTPLRILHAPQNIANQAGYAAAALRRMGHHVEVWQYGANPFGFPVDRVVDVAAKDPRVLWEAFRDATEQFDVFHFHFGRSLLASEWSGLPPFWDLPIYRALGKKVFFTFHGTDARIRRIHEQVNPWSHYRGGGVPAEDDRTEKALEVIRTYADRMFVVSVNLLHFVPEAEVLPRIIDLSEWPLQLPAQRERPRILHLPTNRATKGTQLIIDGLERLAAEGVEFDLRFLEGIPHALARAETAAADIVIDNVVAGSYGLASMEAMACGRVAVANLSDEVRAAHPDCPVLHVDPDDFVDRMRALIADPDLRRRLAAGGRDFVARVHDAPVIAARLVECYTAPAQPVARRSMPDWTTLAPKRRIEVLDEQVARLQQDLGRALHREDILRARLGLAPRPARGRIHALARTLLPLSVRRRIWRARQRLRRLHLPRH